MPRFETRRQDFPGVVRSYTDAARSVDGLLLPAGAAWLEAWRLDSGLRLYGADRFPPSPLGSYLAALVIEAALTGHASYAGAMRLETAAGRLEIDAGRAGLLARAATKELARP